jgi:hypothetical protein
MRFIKEHVQHTNQSAIMVKRQDEQRLRAELATNVGLYPLIGVGILDPKNLALCSNVPGNTQRAHHMLPDVSHAAPASGPVSQLITFEQTDDDSCGIGDVLRAHSDQIDSAIHVQLAYRNLSLQLDDRSERDSAHTRVLHCMGVGQEALKRFQIET